MLQILDQKKFVAKKNVVYMSFSSFISKSAVLQTQMCLIIYWSFSVNIFCLQSTYLKDFQWHTLLFSFISEWYAAVAEWIAVRANWLLLSFIIFLVCNI